jgi:ribosomal protein S4E
MVASAANVKDGDRCTVVAGTHKGKSGVVEDRNTSKTGHVTITVRQVDGERFKTLARNVVAERAR